MIDTKLSTNGHAPPTSRAVDATADHREMSPHRKTSLAAGALYLLTFVSIPTLGLYVPVHVRTTSSGLARILALSSAILEMIVALVGIGTAVALYPVVKRHNEEVAMGFVGSRVLEGGTIFASVACLLSVVTLRQAGAGVDAIAPATGLEMRGGQRGRRRPEMAEGIS